MSLETAVQAGPVQAGSAQAGPVQTTVPTAPTAPTVPVERSAANGHADPTPASFTLRRVRSDEYEAVDRLIAEAYAHDYGESDESGDPMRSSAVRDRTHEVWVAVDADGELLGSVTFRAAGGPPLHEDFAEHELDLRLLGVSPRARRRGVAAALMRLVAEEAERSGFTAVALKTAPNMRGAHALYEALGFVRAPERDGLWIGGEKLLDLYTYILPLPSLATESVVDPTAARSVLGRFPSGVVAITAALRSAQGRPAALVIQSFVSLSIDPPRVLLSVGKASTSWPRIAESGSFAATVLSETQGPLARRIAKPGAPGKLEGVPTAPSPQHGHPVLIEGAAWFECEIREEFDGGDHRIVIADVLGFGALHRPERPLVFVGSRFAGVRPVAAAPVATAPAAAAPAAP